MGIFIFGSGAKPQRSGFSLLEMLVALVILSLSLGALYAAATRALANGRIALEYAEATVLAQSVLDQSRFSNALALGLAGNWERYSWQVKTWPVTPDAEDTGLSVGSGSLGYLHVEVNWADEGSARTFDLMTIVPLPSEQK